MNAVGTVVEKIFKENISSWAIIPCTMQILDVLDDQLQLLIKTLVIALVPVNLYYKACPLSCVFLFSPTCNISELVECFPTR